MQAAASSLVSYYDVLIDTILECPTDFIREAFLVRDENTGSLVPFDLWPRQEARFDRLWFGDRPIWGLTDKSREGGETAVNSAFFFLDSLVNGGNIQAVADNKAHAVTCVLYHKWFIQGLRQRAGLDIEADKWNEGEVNLPEVGINIKAQPCTDNVGGSERAKNIHLTEVHRWPKTIDDQVWGAISGTLPPQGNLLVEGAGSYHEGLWKRWKRDPAVAGFNYVERFTWETDGHPLHDETWAMQRMGSMPRHVFEAEYKGMDSTPGEPFITVDYNGRPIVDSALERGTALFAQFMAELRTKDHAGSMLFVGIDAAEGDGEDDNAWCILTEDGLPVSELAGNHRGDIHLAKLAAELDGFEKLGFEIMPVAWEANGVGMAQIELALSYPEEPAYPGGPFWRWSILYSPRGGKKAKPGLWSSGAQSQSGGSKRKWWVRAEMDLRLGRAHLVSSKTASQLARVQRGTLRAPPGEHEDCADAFVIANECRRMHLD